MKRLLSICFLIVLLTPVTAQILMVKDSLSGQPLSLVTLSSEQPRAFTTTNARGQADISGFKGSEGIEVRMTGYLSESFSYEQLSMRSFSISLVPSAISLDRFVISATRWNQSSVDIPSRIATITSREAVLQNPQTAADLLGVSGEVFIQKSQQGGGSPMIRGFATNRLLYTVDGVRMNTAIFRSGNLQNVISLDPFAMESTEIFFGPGSVIYGSDAIGGVMAFQTLTPQLSLDGSLQASGKADTRYSSANSEKTGHFDINLGWKKLALITSFSSNDFGDLRMGSHGPDDYLRPFYVQPQDSLDVIITNEDPKIQRPSGYSQVNLMQKVRYKPNDRWDLQYGFHFSETSDYARYDRHIRYKNGLPRYGEWYYGPQKWTMNNLVVSHHEGTIMYDEMTLRLAQQHFEESRISRDLNKNTREVRVEQVEALSANLDFNRTLGGRQLRASHHLFYGIELVFNNVDSRGTNEDISTGISVPGPARYPLSTWWSGAAYITDQYRISERLLLEAGARYSRYALDALFDTTFYPLPFTKADFTKGALTGSIGMVFRPTAKWLINAGFATGFRSPNVDDMGKVFDSSPGNVVVPNPDLESEYAWNAELSVARMFGNSIRVDITAYCTLLDNALVVRDYRLNGLDSIMYDGTMSKVKAVQNAATANVGGVQAGVEFRLPAGFSLLSRINYQKGTEEMDDGTTSPTRHAAPAYGLTKIIFSASRINLQVYCLYSAGVSFENMPVTEVEKPELYARDDEGNPYSPGWYTLNFKALFQATDFISISAGLENITDQRYRPYSSGMAGAGRNFILSARVTF